MPWITIDPVEAVLQTDLSADSYILELIDHAQGLAEIEVGAQATPNAGLKSILTQIVARMWQAGQSAKMNPAGLQSETTGPFTFQNVNAGVAGLGLTNREKAQLRKAAGLTGIWVQPTSRGDHLETAPSHDELEDATDPIDTLAAAQQDLHR